MIYHNFTNVGILHKEKCVKTGWLINILDNMSVIIIMLVIEIETGHSYILEYFGLSLGLKLFLLTGFLSAG